MKPPQSSRRRQQKVAASGSLLLIGWIAFSSIACLIQSTTAATISIEHTHLRSGDLHTNTRRAIIEQSNESNHIPASEMASSRPSFADYTTQRKAVVHKEHNTNFESDTPSLSDREQLANAIIMDAKRAELASGHENPHSFAPSQHFFDVMDKIRASKLFKILRRMPKGGILHGHDTALASTDFLVSITYREHLWQCNDTVTKTIVNFRFSRDSPAATEANLVWSLVAHERTRVGTEAYDAHIRSLFTLRTDNPRLAYQDINDVWNKFMSLFMIVEPLITYVPVWRDYYRQTLKEAFEDNVQYVEFRGLLPNVYDLDGNTYTQTDVARMYVEVLAEFNANNSEFIGSKFIFAPIKSVPDTTFEEYVATLLDLHREFPSFIAGFDLVGQEDTGRKLATFSELLLQLPEDIKFFFHAGETNWFGSIDENLIDAILLGSLRIGHAFALSKHPVLLQMVKERDIAIEVNPLSNQILKLVDDMRNHPAATYFADNVPLVISSDDPSFWEATPLTDDFYQAFIGIASAHSDLRTLKKLATNSIKYSSMNAKEKVVATQKWQVRWDRFIDEVIADTF